MAASSLGERFKLKDIFRRKRIDVRKWRRGVVGIDKEIRRGAALD
jgi:hypothetical protein